MGPDAFHEYETLLLQDFEELVRKRETKSGQSEDSEFLEQLTFEDDGWSRLTSSEEDTSTIEANSHGKDLYTEDVGQQLIVSVHHFPMILCPLSPRVFVLPSEGSVAEACLSVEHEDSLSPGLPPIGTGLFSDGDDVPPGAIMTAHLIYHLASKVIRDTFNYFFLIHLRIFFNVSRLLILQYGVIFPNCICIFFPMKLTSKV